MPCVGLVLSLFGPGLCGSVESVSINRVAAILVPDSKATLLFSILLVVTFLIENP